MTALAERFDRWCALPDAAAAWQERVPLGDTDAALVPICSGHLDDEPLLAMLANWRNRHVTAFPSRSSATEASTRRWLEHNVLPGDRALLLIARGNGDDLTRAIGHVGICGYRAADTSGVVELENIVRGVDGTAGGVMAAAMRALMQLCEHGGVLRQTLRVFDDNRHAIRFYERLGFTPGERTPMAASSTPGDASLHPMAAGEAGPAVAHLLSMHRTATAGSEASA